jgi:small conductance mechanosensitive channel
MEPTITPENPLVEETVEIVNQVSEYGHLIMGSLYLIIGGMIAVYILHKLASKFIYPHIANARLIRVVLGTLYVLVLVITALLVLKKMGFDVTVIGQLALIGVLIGAVIIFFLVPFFPRLPFLIGHLVEVNGELGIVDSITTFHTTLRKFDGTMVFIPNALVMASKIKNISDTPARRIELKLSVNTDSNLEETKALFSRIMREDERVLDEPASPAVFITNVTAAGVDIFAVCWVKNEDWLSTRSDLWMKIVDNFINDERVAMSLPQQEVYLIDNNVTS